MCKVAVPQCLKEGFKVLFQYCWIKVSVVFSVVVKVIQLRFGWTGGGGGGNLGCNCTVEL